MICVFNQGWIIKALPVLRDLIHGRAAKLHKVVNQNGPGTYKRRNGVRKIGLFASDDHPINMGVSIVAPPHTFIVVVGESRIHLVNEIQKLSPEKRRNTFWSENKPHYYIV